MRKSRFSEEQIIKILKRVELGQPLTDVCREEGISDATYARALAAFGEQGVMDTVGITGYYSLLGMVLNTARTPAGDSGSPILRPLAR